MKRFAIFYCLILISLSVCAQTKLPKSLILNKSHKIKLDSIKTKPKAISDVKAKTGTVIAKPVVHLKLIPAVDTLTPGDYLLSIDRVNDNLNDINDSAKLGFEVVGIGRRIDEITNDIKIIRQNIRDKRSALNIKNLYLYQSFATNLDDDNDRLQARLIKMYNRVYDAKLRLKYVLSDSIFHRLYADSSLRNKFDKKLLRLEHKWAKDDTLAKENIDSLNALKVRCADNAITLSNMMNSMENKLDKAAKQLFGQEVNCIWQKSKSNTIVSDTSKKALNTLGSEQKAIGYYFSQTSGERTFIFVLGILLFVWLFFKRKLIKLIKAQKDTFAFLQLQYMNKRPVLSILVLLLCLTPFFDAYAPTSYISIEYFLLLLASSVILFNRGGCFRFNWLALVAMLVAITLTFLIAEPTLASRLFMILLQTGVIVFSVRFIKKLNKQTLLYKWVKAGIITGIVISVIGILFNVFGRFSLSGSFGLAGIFAVTQAVIMPLFIETIIEIVLLQLQSSRFKKGVDKPFDSSVVANKIKGPLVIIAMILWVIMLASNLNIYHSIHNKTVDMLTLTRTIGSISFKIVNVIFFFAIIWLAHILQQLISFLFGETGAEMEDVTTATKGQHSRLLITRLLVLIGGYLLAIAASGLPIDKLTFLLGALGVGIGMGLQSIVNNFVSGIILIFDGSLKIGDEIEVSGQAGKVKELGLRASTLSTADGAEVIIPNGTLLSQNITNWTFSNDEKRVVLQFSLTGKELDANIINEVINDSIKFIPNAIIHRKPVILYTKVTPDSCSLIVKFWSNINKADHVNREAMLKLSAAFTVKNIGFE